jgi:hypothetical protein
MKGATIVNIEAVAVSTLSRKMRVRVLWEKKGKGKGTECNGCPLWLLAEIGRHRHFPLDTFSPLDPHVCSPRDTGHLQQPPNTSGAKCLCSTERSSNV